MKNDIIQRLSDIQEELEDIAIAMEEIEKPEKSICEILKDNFLSFINKNIKQM